MDKTLDISLKEGMELVIKDYLRENLSVVVEIEGPDYMCDRHKVTVKLSLNGELIDRDYDTIYIPS